MSAVPIVPAFIPRSQTEVIEMTKVLAFSHEIHLDVVDGIFVGTPSWPYEPSGIAQAVKSYTDAFTLEVDLMVNDPVKAAKEWLAAGADMLVFHVETIDLPSFIDFSNQTNVSIGISLHGDTDFETFLSYMPYADYVQFMGIREIGSQGQPFDDSVLERITLFKQQFPHVLISVDGSVNEHTIAQVTNAGADRCIVGSAIVKQSDPYAAYKHLQTLIQR
jgi:ribulose-phosphate 3-epimerase